MRHRESDRVPHVNRGCARGEMKVGDRDAWIAPGADRPGSVPGRPRWSVSPGACLGFSVRSCVRLDTRACFGLRLDLRFDVGACFVSRARIRLPKFAARASHAFRMGMNPCPCQM